MRPEPSDDASADDILIGLCRRFLTLNSGLELYRQHRIKRDDPSFRLTHDEWQRTMEAITPISAEAHSGRVAKLHAARVAMCHGKDADALVKAALNEFATAHPFAAEPLRPGDIKALQQALSVIEAVGTITIEIANR